MPASPFENYRDQVNAFNERFGVNFSFERFEIKRKQMNHMREFFTKDSTQRVEDGVYKWMLNELYRECVESAIMKKIDSVDHSALFSEFEKLMDHYRLHCAEVGANPPRKNGGWKSGVDIVEDMEKKIANIPADKSDFVKNNYVKRSIRLRDMRADLASMEKNGKNATVEELSRAIVYKRALEKAIKERSFGWRAIHWFQGPAEKRDLEAINRFIGKYEHWRDYPKAEAFADENVVGTAMAKLAAAKEEIKAKELLRPRRLKEAGQGMERMIDKKVNEHVYEQILGVIEASTSDEATKSAVARGLILVTNKGTIQKMWREFEKATTVEEKKALLHSRTQQIFKDTFGATKGLKGMDVKARIVAAQKITDLVQKQYSPATSDKAYDQYTENYVVSDEAFMGDFMKDKAELSGEELKNFISDVKVDISTKKEKIMVSDNEISSKKVETSEKHVDAPKIDGRVMSN